MSRTYNSWYDRVGQHMEEIHDDDGDIIEDKADEAFRDYFSDFLEDE